MYSNLLKEVMEDEDVNNICIKVDLGEVIYPLCFIRKETLKHLVVDSTGDDGCERVVIIPKDMIISVGVVYEQDVCFEKEEKRDEMFR